MENLFLVDILVLLMAAMSILFVYRKYSSSRFMVVTEFAFQAIIRRLRMFGCREAVNNCFYNSNEFSNRVLGFL